MHPTTRALLEAISRVLDVSPVQSDSAAVLAASDASAAWNAAGRPDLQPVVGGPPPDPWPGMGVELAGRLRPRVVVNHVKLDTADPTKWRLVLPDGYGAMTYEPANIAAVYDGRVCVWRRE